MRFLIFIFCLVGLQVQGQTLIQHVTLVDVVRKRLVPDQDVLIAQGKFAAIGKTGTIKLPANTQIIDGAGQFIMPGLIDAHVHFFQSGGLFTRPDVIDYRSYQPYATELAFVHKEFDVFRRMYLAAGITSVADVGASYAFLQQRQQTATVPNATQVFMSGPLLTTWLPPAYKELGEESPFVSLVSAEQAQQSVAEQVKRGADFIKIWYIAMGANPAAMAKQHYPLVKATIDAAHAQGKRVAVHATELITAQLAVEAGADFLVHSIDDTLVTPAFIQLLLQKKTVLCPTLTVAANYRAVFGDRFAFSTEALNQSHPFAIRSIIDYPWPDTTLAKRYIRAFKKASPQDAADSIAQQNLRLLAAAGVPIATGTDAGNIGTQHVSSYAAELAAMQGAGLNTWQILVASTLHAARALGTESQLGSVQVNKQADFILLPADPTTDYRNSLKPSLVAKNGKMFKPDSLVPPSPVWLVQQQLNAYNAHNLEAFLEPYSDSVAIYNSRGVLMMKGKKAMRASYQFIQQVPGLHCRLLNRMESGNTIIDHEEIWMDARPGKPQYGVAMYTIDKGKIVSVVFGD
jgi:imidazolonepropionase-like amidohydrolase